MHRRIAWIFLIAFVMRALLPPGFMLAPGAAGGGVFQVVVCSSQGTKLVTVDEYGQPVEPGNERAGESITCAYGPPPVAMANIAALDVAVEHKAERIAHDRARAFALTRNVIAARYARGPPSEVSI
jgi:hypothetical protein